jgi:hypothetical protein
MTFAPLGLGAARRELKHPWCTRRDKRKGPWLAEPGRGKGSQSCQSRRPRLRATALAQCCYHPRRRTTPVIRYCSRSRSASWHDSPQDNFSSTPSARWYASAVSNTRSSSDASYCAGSQADGFGSNPQLLSLYTMTLGYFAFGEFLITVPSLRPLQEKPCY